MPQLPATAAPIARTRKGLPMQIIGPFLEDRTTIGFAAQPSKEFGMTAQIAPAWRQTNLSTKVVARARKCSRDWRARRDSNSRPPGS
jgi:hypothetical protein